MQDPITVFLASSSELAAERSAVEIFVGRKNKLWAPKGLRLELVHWEDFDDAMSMAGKQADYNAAITTCDVFVLLVNTKLGKYSREEFETAWQRFQSGGKPRIYIYLKDPPEAGKPDPGPNYDTVRAFQRRLSELQHFPTVYHDPNGLLLHLEQTLNRLESKGRLQSPPMTVNLPRDRLATSQLGAGSVVVGGANSGNINTGTQAIGNQVFGGVHIGQGDYVAGDKIVQSAGSGDVLAQLLVEVQRQAPEASRGLAVEHVNAVQEAVQDQSVKPDDGKLARLLNGLVDLVPDAMGVVVGTFGSPLLAGMAGPATEALLKRLKGL
jgi:hypothetical protein